MTTPIRPVAVAPAPMIDLLPPTVHVETQRRRDRPFKTLAVVAAILLCGLGVMLDRAKTASLMAQRDALRTTTVAAVDQVEAQKLREVRARLDDQADLVATFLPTASASRLTATIAASLPSETHLTSLRYQRIDGAGRSDATPPKETESVWVRDRFARTQVRARQQIEVIVEGVTADDASLGSMLRSIDQTGVFDQAVIDFSEPATLRELPRRRFRMTLRRSQSSVAGLSGTGTRR